MAESTKGIGEAQVAIRLEKCDQREMTFGVLLNTTITEKAREVKFLPTNFLVHLQTGTSMLIYDNLMTSESA